MKTSVTSLLLKTKQKTTVLKVSGLKSGDSIVSWKSSNTKVVTVSGKTNGTSTVTAGALKGTATITITLKSGLKKTVKVTVQPTTVKTTKISGNPGRSNFKERPEQGITASSRSGNKPGKSNLYIQQNIRSSCSFQRQDHRKAKGTAVITVKSGTKTVKCKVTVN